LLVENDEDDGGVVMMMAKHKHDNPILVTGAAGAVGGIGRNLTEFLLARGGVQGARFGSA
jgi:nucleoside-diphosphate-sugar epimerase